MSTTIRDGSEVKVVKNGILKRYDSTTVGKAFEGTFQNPKWTSFVTNKGATVVEFNGSIQRQVLESAGFSPTNNNYLEVRNVCIASLNPKGKTEQEAQAYEKEGREFNETLRNLDAQREHASSEELVKLIKYRDELITIHYEKRDALYKEFAAANEVKIRSCIGTAPLPVKFQFTLSTDQTTFKLSAVDLKPWGTEKEDEVIPFIYH